MVINVVLDETRQILKEANIDTREARLLLAYSMGFSADDLIKETSCTEEEYNKCISYAKRRVLGEPFAYIVRLQGIYEAKIFCE